MALRGCNLLPHGDAPSGRAFGVGRAGGVRDRGRSPGRGVERLVQGCVAGDTEPIRVEARTNVQDGCLVGMGATILNGAKIGEGSIVAAGALVPEGKEYPPGSLIVVIPAKRVKDVSEKQTEDIARGVREYVERAASHRESLQREA